MGFKKLISDVCDEVSIRSMSKECNIALQVLKEMRDIKNERKIGEKTIRWWVFAIAFGLTYITMSTFVALQFLMMIVVFVVSLVLTIVKLCFAVPSLLILAPIKWLMVKAETEDGLARKIVCVDNK